VVGLLAVAAVGASGWVREPLQRRVAEALAGRLPGARLAGPARLDWRMRVVAGPVLVGAGPDGVPVVTVERLTVGPRLRSLLRGRLEPGSVVLDGVRVEAGTRGEALAELVRARAGGASAPPEDGTAEAHATPEVVFRRLVARFHLARGVRALAVEVGPLSGRVRSVRDGDDRRVELGASLPGGGRMEALLGWRGGEAPSLRGSVRGATWAAVPAALRARLPLELSHGAVSLAFDAAALAPAGEARVSGEARDAVLRAGRLGPEPLGPLALRGSALLQWDAARERVALRDGHLELGGPDGAAGEFEASLEGRRAQRFAVRVAAREVDWQRALAALPAQLRPPPETPAVAGHVSASLELSGSLAAPDAWRVRGDLDAGGLAPAVGTRGRGLDLARPFTWRAPLPGGGTRAVEIGPENPRFVPLAALPPYVVRAVVLSEDAGFYGHGGFDLREIEDALARAGERRRLRGASTITQQLAKNLLVGPERTLLRKGREALATLALEASVPKRRLLEIYLNLAEWGSGVRGIGEAARHWFGKDARELTPKEAAFLATVIPNPVRYETYRRRGALSEAWETRVRELLVKLRGADALGEEEFYEAWWAPLRFASE
jgi:hypothetical protein